MVMAQSIATEQVAKATTAAEKRANIAAAKTEIEAKNGRMATLIGADVPGVISGVTIDATGKVTALIYTAGSNVYTYDANGAITIS